MEKILPPCLRDGDFEATTNGDFATESPENNYIRSIAFSSPGHWKEFPLIGIGIYKYLQSNESKQVVQAVIREQLESDIFKKPMIDLSNYPPEININKVTVSTR